LTALFSLKATIEKTSNVGFAMLPMEKRLSATGNIPKELKVQLPTQ